MNTEELKEILEKHRKWINSEDGGERANLSGADLGFDCCFARVKGQPIYQVCGVGLFRRTLTLHAKGLRNDWVWSAGCFSGNEKDLREAVEEKYGKDCDYMDAIEFLVKTAKRHSAKYLIQ